MVDKTLTYVGKFETFSSFPIANRHLATHLGRLGWTVQRNGHNVDWGPGLAPFCLAFEYPPAPVNMRHDVQVCMSIWEFQGPQALPLSFVDAFKSFDLVLVPNAFNAALYQESTTTPVQQVRYLGVDPDDYHPQVEPADWGELFPGESWVSDAEAIILGVGGTDLRHGWDVGIQVLDQLPDNVHMVIKVSPFYRVDEFGPLEHPRLHILKVNMPSLAPLYTAADMFLLPARGVGFALPVLEALACGLPVAASDLPPMHDLACDHLVIADGGQWASMGTHHVHPDCRPLWWEPELDGLVSATQAALSKGRRDAVPEEWINEFTWEAAARRLSQTLEEFVA